MQENMMNSGIQNLSEQEIIRRDKLKTLQEEGKDPYQIRSEEHTSELQSRI